MKIGGWLREDRTSRAALIPSQPSFSSVRASMSQYTAPGSKPSDLRRFSPAARHNQLSTSSCVANAMTRALENKRIQQLHHDAMAAGAKDAEAMARAQAGHVALSRLALYYLSREQMFPPETDKDRGTIISIAAELLRTFGVSREERDPSNPADSSFWPFDADKVFTSPPWKAMREAAVHKISSWSRITSAGSDRVDDVIAALSAGNVVVYGTQVGSGWQQYKGGGVLGVPKDAEGGHATMLCGWDPSGFFWDENSWSNSWGEDGFCRVSPDVVASEQSEDFVVVQGGWEPWHQKSF